jgi:hypothetical protein
MSDLVQANGLSTALATAETPTDLTRVLDMADALGTQGRRIRKAALANDLLPMARDAYRAEIVAAFARLEVVRRIAEILPDGQGTRSDLSLGVTSSDFGITRQTAARWKTIRDRVGKHDLAEVRDGWLPKAGLDPARWTDPTTDNILADIPDEPDDEWYTPPWLFDALGLTFDLDVCAPVDRTYSAVPAERFYTEENDGLAQPWDGLVWCNPPYSTPRVWAERMIDHGDGVLLSHVPINGLWCLDVWDRCDRLRLLQGMEFVRPDGNVQRPAYWLQLVAFGGRAARALDEMTVAAEVRDRFRPSRVLS